MEKLGYYDRFQSRDRIVHLPNTTLIHFDKTVTTAVNDAKTVDRRVGSNLLRCISVEMHDGKWDGFPGT